MDMHGNTVGSRGSLSLRQEAILVGKILGDGCLEKNGNHVRLKIEQSDKQKEYVLWLYEQLNPFVGGFPKAVLHTGWGKETKRWRFATRSLLVFDKYYELFYVQRRKRIPSTISSFLVSPLTLAVWYMDDGYMRTDKSGAYLCTSSFTIPEHQQLQYVLEQNFDVHTSIHFAGKYARLHIPSRDLRRFVSIIEPYIVGCMRYKLSLTP